MKRILHELVDTFYYDLLDIKKAREIAEIESDASIAEHDNFRIIAMLIIIYAVFLSSGLLNLFSF